MLIFYVKYDSSNGYSLSSLLIINFLVISLFLGMISLLFFENFLAIKQGNNKKLQMASQNTVNKKLFSLQNDSSFINEANDSTLVKTKNINKGLYYSIKAESKNKSDSLNGIFTHCIKPTRLFGNAIILTRPELIPTSAGNTNITGDLLTAKRKINKGRLFGVAPLSNNFLNGEIIADETINPKIFNETLFRSLFEHITDNESVGDEVYIINELMINKLKNINFQIPNNISIEGFLAKGNELETLNLYVNGKTHFTNETKSTYNFQICSDSTISIGENVHLENAVLVSQTNIDVGSNCSFKNVQLFAKDSITISNSEFLFPSIIGLYAETDGKNKYENKIDISSSVINGTVMLVSSTVGLDENKSKIKIDEESVIQGLVYCENNLELYGEVKGCVYTYNFLYMDGKKEYLNWLVNVKVNRYELDERFLLPMGFVEDPEYSLIKEEWYH